MKLPICPECNKPMIFCFAIPYKEYICIPCGTSKQFLCEREECSAEEHETNKKLYENDIHALAMRNGALCVLKHEGKPCKICDDLENYQYQYYMKPHHPQQLKEWRENDQYNNDEMSGSCLLLNNDSLLI